MANLVLKNNSGGETSITADKFLGKASALFSKGRIVAEAGAEWPAVSGLSMSHVYNNGYPTTYGNVLTMYGDGCGQLLIGWSGQSGANAPAYIRSKRDTTDANWSSWQQLATTDGSVNYSNSSGYASSADTVDGYHASSLTKDFYLDHSIFSDLTNNGYNGMTYCGGATDGYLCIGREWGWNSDGNNFGMQIEVSGWDGTLRTRSFNGWGTGWTSWKTYIHDGNIGSQSVNYANSAGQLYTSRSIFGRSFNGTEDINGKATHYGTYTSNVGARYYNSSLEIRENDLVANSQSDIGYAPAIGFHWGNMCAGTLCYNGTFYFKTQQWERATIDANLSGWASTAGNASTCGGTALEWSGQIYWDETGWIAAWNSDGSKIKALNKNNFAAANHTHSYVPTSGGTISGKLSFSSHTWASSADVDNAPLYFGQTIDTLTSSTYYKPWFGGSHGIQGQGYYATIVAGLYHTSAAHRGGFYIGGSWDHAAADTYYYFARDGHFITPKLVVSSNYGTSFPSDVYIGEIYFYTG